MPTEPSGPSCRYGYTRGDLEALFGDRLPEFFRWMRGQTVSVCDGRAYDHDKREYHDTGCGPHGTVVYPWDVEQYLRGGRPLD